MDKNSLMNMYYVLLMIVRRRGAGTFVKDYDASSEDATQLKQSGLGLTRKLKGKGELKSEIIEFSVIPSDEHISKKYTLKIRITKMNTINHSMNRTKMRNT